MAKQRNDIGRTNSLGLSESGLKPLFDSLDSPPESASGKAARKAARWPIRNPSIRVMIDHPGGSQVELRMACRNLSTTGAGLLHSGYLYSDTACTIELIHPERGPTHIPARVIRCEHRTGVIHEVGVRFENPIDLRAYVRPNPIEQWFEAENVDPASLEGRLLYIDGDPIHQKLVGHFLKNSRVVVSIVSDGEEAVGAAANDFDLVLCEHHLKPICGAEIAQRLRAQNIRTPFLLTSLDSGPGVMNAVDGRTIDAFIAKPLTESVLLRAVSEFLSKHSSGAASAESKRKTELYNALKPHLVECADGLARAIKTDEPMDVVSLCMQIRQIDQALELGRLGSEIDAILEPLSESMRLADFTRELASIVKKCREAA